MSKSGFEDEVLIKLIVGLVKHVTIDELGPVDTPPVRTRCRFGLDIGFEIIHFSYNRCVFPPPI
jgi:hypothetical protein